MLLHMKAWSVLCNYTFLLRIPFHDLLWKIPPIWTPTLKQKNSSSSQNICENQKNPPILNKGQDTMPVWDETPSRANFGAKQLQFKILQKHRFSPFPENNNLLLKKHFFRDPNGFKSNIFSQTPLKRIYSASQRPHLSLDYFFSSYSGSSKICKWYV